MHELNNFNHVSILHKSKYCAREILAKSKKIPDNIEIMGDVALVTISEYFRTLKGTGWGALNSFAKTYKLPNWLISRIIDSEGIYEPRRNYMVRIVKGIIENPLESVILSDHFRLEVLKMATDDVDMARKFMAILSYKSKVNPTIFQSLIALVDVLYSEVSRLKAAVEINKTS